jgi:UDP:flavonoid glycosyltransferase YjiC (YdhE family)
VLWAVPPDGLDQVEAAGIRAAAVGTPGLMSIAAVQRQFPEIGQMAPADRPDVMFAKLFGAIAAPAVLADLADVAHSWRPDLVVADASDLAAPIVAAELGVPNVTKAFGPLLPERRVAAGGDEVAPLWRDRGLEPRPYGGLYDHLYLDIFPRGLQPTDDAHVPHRQLLRPVTYDGPEVSAGPLPRPPAPPHAPDAPLVYVTMGTVFNGPAVLEVVVNALADLQACVLVTVGPAADLDALGTHPANVRIERYVPQTRVLPEAAVVVSHSGSGTVVATLDHGLPQLCLPQGADQFLNARAVG